MKATRACCKKAHFYCPIAQLVEQRTVNPCVPGSSPGWGAKLKEPLQTMWGFFTIHRRN